MNFLTLDSKIRKVFYTSGVNKLLKGAVYLALFKINRGDENNLPAELKDGWAYFCTNNGNFHIDYMDAAGELHRKQISAEYASNIRYLDGDEYIYITAEQIAAAVNNLQIGQVQADWNQTDETAADYIKNKPALAQDEEVFELLSSQDIIAPVTDSTNYMYLDNDGSILIM